MSVAHDWSNVWFPLNSVLDNPPGQYRVMDGCFQVLAPGAYMGVLAFKIVCFAGWWRLGAGVISGSGIRCLESWEFSCSCSLGWVRLRGGTIRP